MFPIGTIIPYAGDLSKIPYGWHVCDGTNGTPDLSDRFLEGTTTAPKIFKEAGLPNITGSVGRHYTVTTSGVFYIGVDRNVVENVGIGGEFTNNATLFDASLSNPIYGASETVQPKSYTAYYIMRIL